MGFIMIVIQPTDFAEDSDGENPLCQIGVRGGYNSNEMHPLVSALLFTG